MFHGSACDENIQNLIDYAAIESEINGVIFRPVPDLTAIYFSVKELKTYTKEIVESVRNDIHWTQVFVKYSSTIQKFRYINTLHSQLQNRTITHRHYIYEVGAQFAAGGHTFLFYLTDFNHMMMGTGFGDKHNILDIFRKSLDQESGDPVGCTKDYTDKLDYFVRFMFALEKEAVLAWSKYLLITGKSENIGFVEMTFKEVVSEQWRLYNRNGCGHLQAVNLQNNYCVKPYHSTHQQQVKLRCHGQYKPFPETMFCSLGQWSALPMCYTEPVKGRVVCTTENGATICKASCFPGWGVSPSSSSNYRCSTLPCPSFSPPPCDHCTSNSVCKDHEVCTGPTGTCRDACLVKPCGINVKCSPGNHGRSCTCLSPWKGNPDLGCRSQDLQWMQTTGQPYSMYSIPTGLNYKHFPYILLFFVIVHLRYITISIRRNDAIHIP